MNNVIQLWYVYCISMQHFRFENSIDNNKNTYFAEKEGDAYPVIHAGFINSQHYFIGNETRN